MKGPAQVVPLHPGDAPPAGGIDRRTDEDLLRLAAAGVVPAFAEIVRRHEPKVRTFCSRWCGSQSVGDELAQDVFVDLWCARTRYQPRGRFAAFLFTLARNRCRSERRRRNLQPVPFAPVEVADDQLDAVLEAERRRRVDQRISDLPPKLREALMLRCQVELSYEEIARIVGANETTVRSRVFLAVSQLRDWAKEADL